MAQFQNVGELERFVRLVIGVVGIALVMAGWFDPLWSLVLVPLALTALAGFCPVYAVLGLSTCSPESHH